MSYEFLYCQSMLMCAAILIIMLIFDVNVWRREGFSPLCMAYALLVVSCVSDCIWKLVDGNPDYIWLNNLVNDIIMIVICLSVFFYMWYVVRFSKNQTKEKEKLLIPESIPAVIIILLTITNFQTGFLFKIDENGYYIRGNGYYFEMAVVIFYFVISEIVAVRSYFMVEEKSAKGIFIAQICFPIPTAIFTIVQMFTPPGLPGIQYGAMFSLLIMFIVARHCRITNDHLTGLGNRIGMEDKMAYEFGRRKRGYNKGLYVINGDIDEFKKINDKYGHQKGDAAIGEVATAIERCCEKINADAFRVAGDEFLIIYNTDFKEDVVRLISGIQETINEITVNEPYDISISLGYKKYEDNMTKIQLLKGADEEMFKIKKEKKLSR